jgi:hypothetical protein
MEGRREGKKAERKERRKIGWMEGRKMEDRKEGKK